MHSIESPYFLNSRGRELNRGLNLGDVPVVTLCLV